jgi:hypothetical protein
MKASPNASKINTDKLVGVAVSSLTNTQIDWLISSEEGVEVIFDGAYIRYALADENELGSIYSPSTDAALGHPLLEREKIQSRYIDNPGHPSHGLWLAQDCRFRSSSKSVEWLEYGRSYADLEFGYLAGPTMLIAGLRFIIAKNLVGKLKSPHVNVPAALASKARKKPKVCKEQVNG